jgi:tetratricopeptide (TPR) repeat protein
VLAKPKKISRKKVKEDKLVTYYHKTLKFYEDFQTKIIIGVGAIAVLVVIVILLGKKSEQDNLAATTQLARVVTLFESGSYQEAIDGKPGTNIVGLTNIVDNYSGTEQGELAKIYLAHSYYFLGDIDKALEYYDDYSGSDPMFIAAALAGSASCYEAKNESEEAARLFKKASSVSESNAANHEYLLKSGINFIDAGMKDEAKIILEKLKSEYSTSSSSKKADRYLALVK